MQFYRFGAVHAPAWQPFCGLCQAPLAGKRTRHGRATDAPRTRQSEAPRVGLNDSEMKFPFKFVDLKVVPDLLRKVMPVVLETGVGSIPAIIAAN